MTYLFRTTTTMKHYNGGKWWIDGDMVKDIEITAGNIKEALTKYAERVNDRSGVNISKSAIKNRRGMYRDTKNGTIQTGYVITGSSLFDRGNYTGFVKQYIDLWVEVLTVSYPAELTA